MDKKKRGRPKKQRRTTPPMPEIPVAITPVIEEEAPVTINEETRAAITTAILQKLIPEEQLLTEIQSTPIYEDRGFSIQKFVDLCRMLSLGLNLSSACNAVGLAKSTVWDWRNKSPQVDAEIKRAESLAIGAVARILRQFMKSENEMVALRATEFFLRTRSAEFREKATIEVEHDANKIHKQIAQELYGFYDEAEKAAMKEAKEVVIR